MAFYQEVFQQLADIGLLDVILPFLVIYALTYGILQRTKTLGGKKNTDALIAFCIGFFAVAATQLMNIFNILLGWAVMALVVTIMLALILGLSGAKLEGNKYMIGLGVAVFAIMLLSGLFAAGVLTQDQFQSAVLMPLILSAALIGVVVYVLLPAKKNETGETQPAQPAPPGNPAPPRGQRTP